jgi:hypothetical protein
LTAEDQTRCFHLQVPPTDGFIELRISLKLRHSARFELFVDVESQLFWDDLNLPVDAKLINGGIVLCGLILDLGFRPTHAQIAPSRNKLNTLSVQLGVLSRYVNFGISVWQKITPSLFLISQAAAGGLTRHCTQR